MSRLLETKRRQEFLQWFGLLGAPLVWTLQLVVGFGLTLARCGAGSAHWGVNVGTWQIVVMIAAATIVVLAEAASLALYLGLRDLHYTDPPPLGRRNFFVAASSFGNVLFLTVILVSGIGTLAHVACRQS